MSQGPSDMVGSVDGGLWAGAPFLWRAQPLPQSYTVAGPVGGLGGWNKSDFGIPDTQGESALPSPSRFPGNQSQENSTR